MSMRQDRQAFEELLRRIVERAVEAEGVPLPEIWKGSVTNLCVRVITKLIGAEAAVVALAAEVLKAHGEQR